MTGDWSLRNIENWLYCRISHLEISVDAYFQLFNSTIALLDIEFDPIFPVFNQTGGWNLKNIRKLYRWVSHPEISVNTYFQHYSSIALLNSKFWPHFPRVWADIGMWRHKRLSKSKEYQKNEFITIFTIQKLIYMQIFDFLTWVQDEEWWFLLSIFSKIKGEIREVGHPLLWDYVSFSKFLPSLSDHPRTCPNLFRCQNFWPS